MAARTLTVLVLLGLSFWKFAGELENWMSAFFLASPCSTSNGGIFLTK